MINHSSSLATCANAATSNHDFAANTLMSIAKQQLDALPVGESANDTDKDMQEAAIARCTRDAIRQFHTQPNPFAWDNQVVLATQVAAAHSNPALRCEVADYYLMLADCFRHMPLDLPVSPCALRQSDYRRQCFYAWLGHAFLKTLNIDLDDSFSAAAMPSAS